LGCEPLSFDALVRPIEDQMLRSIWRITRAAEDAEDALQEALTVIWRRRALFAGFAAKIGTVPVNDWRSVAYTKA
jgi:DNA-directed RNA polymerase specialized sigma24 family protein